jgi:hypothetical protein
MSKRVFLLGVGIALLGVGLAFTDWVLSLRPGVTEANVKRIKPGMRLDEVRAILGSEGRSIATAQINPRDVRELWVWEDKGGLVMVGFEGEPRWNRDAQVIEVIWRPSSSPPLGPLDRLRAWLGL